MAVGQSKLTRAVRYPDGTPVPLVYLSGSRVNLTASSTSTSATALPTGAAVVAIRATGDVWLRFGDSGIGAAAADANSMLFVAGELILPLSLDGNTDPYTHVRALRVGSSDVTVQIERIDAN